MYYEFDTKVLGGLPVTVCFEYRSADRAAGYNGAYSWWITHVNGRKCKKSPKWLYQRLAKIKGAEDRVTQECEDYFTSVE